MWFALLAGAIAGAAAWAARVSRREAMRHRVSLGSAGRVGPLSQWAYRRAGRRHREAQARDVPLAIDLIRLCIESGGSMRSAVDVVVQWGPWSWVPAFQAIAECAAIGCTFDEACMRAEAEHPELRRFADLLQSGARTGASMRGLLFAIGESARADARRLAEARVRRLPVRLLFPLVGCVLPAFLCFAVVPPLLSALTRAGL